MKKRKVILGLLAFVLIGSAIADGVRYLRPARIKKPKVLDQASFPFDSARYIVLVYNANGGIFPGIADFAHKVLAPSTYPCRLCYLTFGTFTMKAEWRSFLASLPFQKTELHKDDYKGPIVLQL